MCMNSYVITPATPADAPAIAAAIMMAFGDELCADIARGSANVERLRELFTEFAAAEDNQYSYRNTLVARHQPSGEVAGALVAYDGAMIRTWRPLFFAAANERLGQSYTDALPFETGPGEVYLDSLAVFEAHRGQHLGRRLIEAMAQRHQGSGLPLGLLVEYPKIKAQQLYHSCGFTTAGEVDFLGTPMLHLQRR